MPVDIGDPDALSAGHDRGRVGLAIRRVGHGMPDRFGVVFLEEIGVFHRVMLPR